MARKGGNPNLPHFKKGYDERRNLKGAPRKLPELNKLLMDVMGDDGDPASGWEQVLRNVKKIAEEDDGSPAIRAAEMLYDRAFGKPKQTIEQQGSVEMRVPKIEIWSDQPPGVPPLEFPPCSKKEKDK